MHENIVVMHEVFKIKSSKPIPKILLKPHQFEKSQTFFKNPNFRSKDMKMHEKEGLRHLPSEENLIEAEKSLKRFGVRERGFGR